MLGICHIYLCYDRDIVRKTSTGITNVSVLCLRRGINFGKFNYSSKKKKFSILLCIFSCDSFSIVYCSGEWYLVDNVFISDTDSSV